MNTIIFAICALISLGCFYFFLAQGRHRLSPLWLMLSVWALGIGIPRLHLSRLEIPLSNEFILLLIISLLSFILGFFIFDPLWKKYPFWEKIKLLTHETVSIKGLRVVIYGLAALAAIGLYQFYTRAGNFPLLAPDSDVFRFAADEKVPGLINYCAQLARIFIPMSFFLMFQQTFSFKKHWDLIILTILGSITLILFASRTQIFFIDLWVMALYLLMRRPNWKQAFKFYPFFLIISVIVLSAVPLIRQKKSYGTTNYLAGVTRIDSTSYNPAGKFLLPIYVGVSFNMQALQHAQDYYSTHQLQHGKVTLDPFTNILGMTSLKSDYNLCDIFECWWNTGTYLFPFVQDFGNTAFYVIPFLAAGLLTLLWRYWKSAPNYLSINLYAYACFFIVMTIYLSFTVRAEMYIDLFVLLVSYLFITNQKNMESLDKLIDQGVLAREREDYAAATEAFDQAFIVASEHDDFPGIIKVIAERILGYKHEFQKTGDPVFNELMFGDIKVGLSIIEDKKMTGQPKAVILLRAGDYYLAKKAFEPAVQNYSEALQNVDQAKPGEYAEYLGHWALARALSGDESSLADLAQALQLAESDTILRPFHKLIVVSGILSRMAEANAALGKKEDAKKYFEAGNLVAQSLAVEHGMQMRLKQFEKLRKELGL